MSLKEKGKVQQKPTAENLQQLFENDAAMKLRKESYIREIAQILSKKASGTTSGSSPETQANNLFEAKMAKIIHGSTNENFKEKINNELSMSKSTLANRVRDFQLENVQKFAKNLQAGVDPSNQVPLVIAKEQSSMAGLGKPILDDAAFFPPSLKRSSSQPSLISEQILALKPPLTVGDDSTVAPSSFMRPVAPIQIDKSVTNNDNRVTNIDNTSTSYDNTVNNTTVAKAQSNIKTSQGGGGQHAVMPHHVEESASFGVNMVSQALRRTIGGGGGPPIFSDGGNGNGPNVPPLPAPYKVPKPPAKRTKGYDLIGNALDRILDPSIHSVISCQQPNAYRSERVRDPSVVGQVPKRMEILEDALFKQPRDPSNATEYGWFKMNDSYCEPAKLGTISAFEKYNADPGIVNLTGMLGDPNGISMDDRFVNNLNPLMFQDKSVQPCGWVDYSKNFLTGFGIG